MTSPSRPSGSRTGARARNQRVPHRPQQPGTEETTSPSSPSPKAPKNRRGGVSGLLVGALLGAAVIGGATWYRSRHRAQSPAPPHAVSSVDPFAGLPAPPPMPDDSKEPVAPEPDLPKPPAKPAPYEGPWLGALAQATPIYPTARFSRNRLGYIRRGGTVPSGSKPIKTRSCRQGFFPLVDGGYVCGKYATLNVKDPRIKHGVKKPDLEKLLPYRYAFNRTHGTPLYTKVPTREEMVKFEPYLAAKKKPATTVVAERETAKAEAEKADQPRSATVASDKTVRPKTTSAKTPKPPRADPKAASSNAPGSTPAQPAASASAKGSVSASPVAAPAASAPSAASSAPKPSTPPASSTPAPTSSAPATAAPPPGPEGGGGSPPAKPWWQRDKGEQIDVRLEDLNVREGVLYKRMVRGFFIAVNRTFRSNGRIWYETTDGLIAPADRMIIPKTPKLKGIELKDGVRQAGFVRAHKAYRYAYDEQQDKPKRLDRLPRFSAVGLTGKTRLYRRARFRETTEGWWLKGLHGTYTSPGKRPSEVGPDEKWIDVNLSRKTLVAFVGDKPVYATLVAPGKRSKNRKRDHRTKVGKWRIREKHVTTTMDGDGTGGDLPYSIQDVPFVQYYDGSYALHGAFWHHNFGREQSHGCVNLAPNDAKFLFHWTEPQLPRGWHGVWSSDKRKGTLVVVHE